MTTLEETIDLMDWLREHGELGRACMTNDGEYEHLPEYSSEENQDYRESEHELRSEGPAANGHTRWFSVLPTGVAGELRGSLEQGRNHYSKNH